MGTRGTRKYLDKQKGITETDPTHILLRSASDLISLARKKDCYNNLSLDIVKLLQFIPGIKLEYTVLDPSISGMLSKRNGVWTITVNKLHNEVRQRFTIAHELGHYIYHKDDEQEFVDTTFFRGVYSGNLEYSANRFASELLMPEEQIRHLIDKDNIRSVADLASKFGVSSAAMLYRVKELRYKTKD